MAPLLLLMTLGTGVLIGITVAPLWLGRGPRGGPPPMFGPDGPPGRGGPSPEREHHIRRAIGGRLQRELDLTEAQRVSLDSVLASQGRAFSTIREEIRPRMQALVEGTRLRIDGLLTPEQRARFRRLDGLTA